MASDAIHLLFWTNATLCIAIVFVLALRVPVRRIAGARVAYALWLIPPAAALAWLLPARQMVAAWQPPSQLIAPLDATAYAAVGPLAAAILVIWLAGAMVTAAVFARRQLRYVGSAGAMRPVRALGEGIVKGSTLTGPAVVGALKPVIVLPSDFDERFTASELALVLEHERTHLARRDPLVNAVVLAVRALNWFNPFIHAAAHALRADQELACDATVLARNSGARRVYGTAMLKSHAPAFAVPAGCAWRPASFYLLKERLHMLNQSAPSRLRHGAGLSFVVASVLAAGGAIWLARPAEVLAAQTTSRTELAPRSREAIELVKVNARLMAACKGALAQQSFWNSDYGASRLRTLVCVGLPRPARREASPPAPK